MENEVDYISCCGCYCKTCKAYTSDSCRGCKLGYDTGERDINKAKCRIKLCCFRDKALKTCADCNELNQCKIIPAKFKPGSRDNKKCMESLDFIKCHGYSSYIEKANNWKNHFGKLK